MQPARLRGGVPPLPQPAAGAAAAPPVLPLPSPPLQQPGAVVRGGASAPPPSTAAAAAAATPRLRVRLLAGGGGGALPPATLATLAAPATPATPATPRRRIHHEHVDNGSDYVLPSTPPRPLPQPPPQPPPAPDCGAVWTTGWRAAALYVALALLRLVCTLAPSYVHPDEMMQSVEVSAAAAFNVEAAVPWEWRTCSLPARSALPQLLLTVLPLLATAAVTGTPMPAGLMIIVPRVVMWAASIAADVALAAVCRWHGVQPWPAVLGVASAWVGAVLATRTFSNTLEMHVLVVALFLWTAWRRSMFRWCSAPSHTAAAGAGVQACVLAALLVVVAVFGTFVRFTFVAFVAPIGVAAATEVAVRVAAVPSWSLRRRVGVVVAGGVAACAVAAVTAAAAAAIDTAFFTGMWPSAWPTGWHRSADAAGGDDDDDDGGVPGWVVAPWNSAVYNANATNTAAHGVHARYTHVAVNGPLLWGPAWAAAAAAVVALARDAGHTLAHQRRRTVRWHAAAAAAAETPRWRRPCAVATVYLRHLGALCAQEAQRLPRPRHLAVMAAAVVVCGTAALSIAPHQEPRFLLPLTPMLAALLTAAAAAAAPPSRGAPPPEPRASPPPSPLSPSAATPAPSHAQAACATRWRGALLLAWLAFNALLAVVFGVVHQGGLLPATALLAQLAASHGNATAAAAAPLRPPAPAVLTSMLWPAARPLPAAAVAWWRAIAPDAGALPPRPIFVVGAYSVPHALLQLPLFSAAAAARYHVDVTLPPVWCHAKHAGAPLLVEVPHPHAPRLLAELASRGGGPIGVLHPSSLTSQLAAVARAAGWTLTPAMVRFAPHLSLEHPPRDVWDATQWALAFSVLTSMP